MYPMVFLKKAHYTLDNPLFFENKENNYYLYGFLFQPRIKNINNRKGIIFCDSIMNEKYYSRRVLVNFARLLQSNGYFVFLFDYYGNGDSEGDFENTRLDTYLSDVKAATAFLMEEAKVEEVCLLGLRVGAVFASLFAVEEKSVERLILWAPIIHVGEYLYDSLRSNLNMQFTVHKKITFNRDQLIQQIKNNILVEVDGYILSKNFYHSLSHVNLKEIKMRSDIKTLVVDVSRNTGTLHKEPGMPFEDTNHSLRIVVREDPFWIMRGTNQRYITEPKILFEKTLSWLEDANGHRRAGEFEK